MILRGITHDYLFISRFCGALKIFLELRGQHAMGEGGGVYQIKFWFLFNFTQPLNTDFSIIYCPRT